MATSTSNPLAQLMYGTDAVGADANTSREANFTCAIALEGLTAAMTPVLQAKLAAAGVWHDIQAIPTDKPNTLIVLPAPFNFVRVTGLAAGATVYGQEAVQ